MFWDRRRATDDSIFIVVKEQHGCFHLALGDATKIYRDLKSAMGDAGRLASKLNDGKYFVFQAVAVSEVTAPRAVTRTLGRATAEREQIERVSVGDLT
jgi:hypothetical protein